MNWLIWKDYRVNRLIVIVAVVLLIVPHGVALRQTLRGMGQPPIWSMNFLVAGIYSLALLQLMFALFGGNAIAGERADRSAEFLAYLPVSRRQKLTSKLVVGLGLSALAWIPNLIILAVAAWRLPGETFQQPALEVAWRTLGISAITGLTFFSVAWLLSSVLESPAYAASGGILTPFLVVSGISAVSYFGDWRLMEESFPLWYSVACATIAILSFAAGTMYYLHRVEP